MPWKSTLKEVEENIAYHSMHAWRQFQSLLSLNEKLIIFLSIAWENTSESMTIISENVPPKSYGEVRLSSSISPLPLCH